MIAAKKAAAGREAELQAELQAAIQDVEAPANAMVNVGDTMSTLRDGIAWVDGEIRRQVRIAEGGGCPSLFSPARAHNLPS